MYMGEISDNLNVIKSSENLDDLYNIFRSVDSHLVIRYKIEKGTRIWRHRRNRMNEEFQKVSDLGCPPANCVKEYGRANIPHSPMFYGSITSSYRKDELGKARSITSSYTEDELGTARFVSMCEISELINGNYTSGIERFTCSVWETKRDLNLISLPFDNNYVAPCKEIVEIQKIQHRFEKDLNNRTIELMRYMSKEISRNDINEPKEYFKIAEFVNFLLNDLSDSSNIDGLLYPSAPLEGNGVNIAIKENVANNFLQFDSGLLCYLVKYNKEDLYLRIIKDIRSNHLGGLLYQERKWCISGFKSLTFIN